MKIAWIRENPPSLGNRRGACLRAVLVQDSQPNGRRSPPSGAQLGAIEERFLRVKVQRMRVFHQGLFWMVVDRNLDKLGLNPEERKTIEAQIAATVPRPPTADWALWGVVCVPRFDK